MPRETSYPTIPGVTGLFATGGLAPGRGLSAPAKKDIHPPRPDKVGQSAHPPKAEPPVKAQGGRITGVTGDEQPPALAEHARRHVVHERSAEPLPTRLAPHGEKRNETTEQEAIGDGHDAEGSAALSRRGHPDLVLSGRSEPGTVRAPPAGSRGHSTAPWPLSRAPGPEPRPAWHVGSRGPTSRRGRRRGGGRRGRDLGLGRRGSEQLGQLHEPEATLAQHRGESPGAPPPSSSRAR